MQGLRALAATSAFVLAALTGCGGASEEGRTSDVAAAAQQGDEGERNADEIAVIRVEDHGEIRLELYAERAPKHVDSFKKLARDGFYDGTAFHRVIPGFMIQGGDPLTKEPDTSLWGTGGPGYTLDAEFSKAPHLRGTLSAARAEDPNSAGSQFFICVERASHLDGNYTVFGKVLEGMDVVDAIVGLERDGNDRPLENVVVESVRIEPRG